MDATLWVRWVDSGQDVHRRHYMKKAEFDAPPAAGMTIGDRGVRGYSSRIDRVEEDANGNLHVYLDDVVAGSLTDEQRDAWDDRVKAGGWEYVIETSASFQP
jgi:hypothetical protein